jgi:hypothetical protein
VLAVEEGVDADGLAESRELEKQAGDHAVACPDVEHGLAREVDSGAFQQVQDLMELQQDAAALPVAGRARRRTLPIVRAG